MWDQKCKEYYEAMGSPEHLDWRDILIPFGLSFDNAPVHRAFRKEALRPRVTLYREFETLFQHAVTGLNFDITKALAQAFRDTINGYVGVGRATRSSTVSQAGVVAQKKKDAEEVQKIYGEKAIDFYIACQFHRLPVEMPERQKQAAKDVFRALMAAFDAKRELYQQQHGFDWAKQFRRDQAMMDHRWLVFLPEQFMPLGNTTPDLHQTAEMLVGIYKAAMRRWAEGRSTRDGDLKQAKCYAAKMNELCSERNTADETGTTPEMTSIKKSIHRMWITCQVVAKPVGDRFRPQPFPGVEIVPDEEIGTGGAFPGKHLS